MRVHSFFAPSSRALFAAGVLVAAPFGCREKMKAEELAEQLATQKASASAVAQASASAPDPKEEKYAQLRKLLRERSIAHMTALQKIYEGSEPDRKSFADWFPPTPEGKKDAEEISKEAAFTGKEGMSIKKFEVQDVNFDPTLTTATTDVWVQESQRGKFRCVSYKLDWQEISGSWRRTKRRDFRILPCD